MHLKGLRTEGIIWRDFIRQILSLAYKRRIMLLCGYFSNLTSLNVQTIAWLSLAWCPSFNLCFYQLRTIVSQHQPPIHCSKEVCGFQVWTRSFGTSQTTTLFTSIVFGPQKPWPSFIAIAHSNSRIPITKSWSGRNSAISCPVVLLRIVLRPIVSTVSAALI
jgi:hypothetical protein